MKRLSIIGVATASLILGFSLVVGSAVGQQNAQLTADVEGVNVASQVFIAAISARHRCNRQSLGTRTLRNIHGPPQHNGCGWLGRRQEGLGDALQPI
jgi:hypothetical protein